ncbi:MAG: energy-coupling factor transporter ATPase [bacterium]|nr:energy-coupling factor transporter ATPase [bacterium]
MKIKFEKICYHYLQNLPYQKEILKDISLEISRGEFVALIGPTGSGKTTLLQHFTGLLKPTSGKIYIDDRDIWQKAYPLAALRKKIGLVFQFPESQLFEGSVFDDVAFGPRALKLKHGEVEQRVEQALRLVGLNVDIIATRSPHELSEGEKRRVAIAGVLAMAPDMLILDEPTAGLDPTGTKLVINMLGKLNREGVTILFVSHNMDLVLQLAQRVLVLSEGTIIFDGARDSILCNQDLLTNVHLELPRISSIARSLYRQKIIADWKIYTISQLKSAIRSGSEFRNMLGE